MDYQERMLLVTGWLFMLLSLGKSGKYLLLKCNLLCLLFFYYSPNKPIEEVLPYQVYYHLLAAFGGIVPSADVPAFHTCIVDWGGALGGAWLAGAAAGTDIILPMNFFNFFFQEFRPTFSWKTHSTKKNCNKSCPQITSPKCSSPPLLWKTLCK